MTDIIILQFCANSDFIILQSQSCDHVYFFYNNKQGRDIWPRELKNKNFTNLAGHYSQLIPASHVYKNIPLHGVYSPVSSIMQQPN